MSIANSNTPALQFVLHPSICYERNTHVLLLTPSRHFKALQPPFQSPPAAIFALAKHSPPSRPEAVVFNQFFVIA